ncbi:MAG: hypothetical protein ICV63_16705 [Coleofasciculus sp. Co-bin14]|nr:hypothetical protein [Coleofasciculus sp. Co-bin14]
MVFTRSNSRLKYEILVDGKYSNFQLNSKILVNSESSNSRLSNEILADGEYYVFTKQEGEKISLGYIYTTWCGSPRGMHMKFSLIELGKPLSLVSLGDSQCDKGQLKTFNFDSRQLLLIDDVYNRAMSWLNKMQREFKYPQIDESRGCIPAVIIVKKGVLSAFYGKDDFLLNSVC